MEGEEEVKHLIDAIGVCSIGVGEVLARQPKRAEVLRQKLFPPVLRDLLHVGVGGGPLGNMLGSWSRPIIKLTPMTLLSTQPKAPATRSSFWHKGSTSLTLFLKVSLPFSSTSSMPVSFGFLKKTLASNKPPLSASCVT